MWQTLERYITAYNAKSPTRDEKTKSKVSIRGISTDEKRDAENRIINEKLHCVIIGIQGGH
jgi:hypothetical protein